VLFKTSYSSKETKEAIEELVGKPFGVIERFKLGGVGSQRLLVEQADDDIDAIIKAQNTPPFTNIELRPKGVILWFRVKLDNWALVLPYYQISIFRNTTDITLHANKWKLKLIAANNLSLDLKFFQKLLQLKGEALNSI
jgi:hypothetical protein